MNKYNNSKIYTIRSHQTDKFYIGSTYTSLSKRFSKHKSNYLSYLDNKYNKTSSFDIIQLNDSYIELLEEFKCDNKDQLRKREGDLIRQYKDQCVNCVIAGRTKQEYETQKIKCSICNKELNKNSIYNHNKTYHNNII